MKNKISSKNLLKSLSDKKREKYNNQLAKLKFEDIINIYDEKSIQNFAGNNNVNFAIENIDSKEFKYYSNLKYLLESASSCQISDAIYEVSNHNGVIPAIKSVNGISTYGRIKTAKTDSNDWGTSLLAIDNTEANEIIFIDSTEELFDNSVDGSFSGSFSGSKNSSKNFSAIWGELTSLSAKSRGIGATIIYGYCRDITELKKLNYPVFSCGCVPNAGKPLKNGKINIPIDSIHGYPISVESGDFIFGDDSGVVHVPKNIFKEVMAQLLKIKINELKIQDGIKKGRSIRQCLNDL
ncbi:RraA family protein [Methanobrevibacter curvatus]|uniref:4-hydroxy-4-methyl-2-oxoglutarate aldolase n=1 Tax=Methanobrevibacter curvatus TaxID=49547 RepID=A0A166CI15_9EURY|nr:RraA family protein [Methanobrevibacter curvatus]KZX14528.1 4-hydroxy-4-methyl-2-oxoglutarate aldolase [Methanobrevibacter curvatus]